MKRSFECFRDNIVLALLLPLLGLISLLALALLLAVMGALIFSFMWIGKEELVCLEAAGVHLTFHFGYVLINWFAMYSLRFLLGVWSFHFLEKGVVGLFSCSEKPDCHSSHPDTCISWPESP